MPVEMSAMITTTIRISSSVKPRAAEPVRRGGRRARGLVADVPVADVGVDAFATGRSVGPQAEEVVLLAVGAGIDVLIVVAPRVLADALDVAPGPPVLDRGIGGLGRQCRKSLLAGRVLGVVQAVHG